MILSLHSKCLTYKLIQSFSRSAHGNCDNHWPCRVLKGQWLWCWVTWRNDVTSWWRSGSSLPSNATLLSAPASPAPPPPRPPPLMSMLEPETRSGAPDRDRDLAAPRGESCDVDWDSPRLMGEVPPAGRDLRPPPVVVGTFRGLGE